MSIKKYSATYALLACYFIIAVTHFFYYPKWQQGGSEATISYDVSGYYMYLPAAFIYDDLKEVKFLDAVMEKYRPAGHAYQAFAHESGSMVMKYSAGQAVIYSPFFAIGHLWATASDAYPADGFSLPYQFMISMGSLIVSFLGLYWLVALLRIYFREGVVALTLLLVVIGTNYLNYAAIDGAMTHNSVFTLYALLLLTSHRFYQRATWGRALLIGACVGLMALTRPTEIIAALIPLLWGLDLSRKGALKRRLAFFSEHLGKLLGAAAVTLLIGSIQLFYWKHVSGDWIVYSYQDQGFDWFSPHLNKGMFSYKAGWLIYTPLMVFGLLGFYPLLLRKPALFTAIFVHALLFIYVAFSWSVWWYGGSLGQRTMVQEYAVLAFPFAAFMEWAFYASRDRSARSWARSQDAGAVEGQGRTAGWRTKLPKFVLGFIMLVFTWHSLYFTHQAHRGGLFLTERMTAAYFWSILYDFEEDPEDQLRLDTSEFFTSTPSSTQTLYTNAFEDQSTASCGLAPINGKGALCLRAENQNAPEFIVDIDLPPRTWIRARVSAKVNDSRRNLDNHAQMLISYRRAGKRVKRRMIRMHRLLNFDWQRDVQIDSKVPDDGADQVVVTFWNGGNTQPALVLDDLVIEVLR